MKRFIGILLCTAMLLMLTAQAFASDGENWICSSCAQENEPSNFCIYCGNRYTAESKARTTLQRLRPGCYVTFGQYEQDNNLSNGAEEIEWLVLDVDWASSTALVLSRYILDAHCFQSGTDSSVFSSFYSGWAGSEIREWLNDAFLNTAFPPEEQRMILSAPVTTPEHYNRSGGPDTMDQIFLLSEEEASQYFLHDSERQTPPTRYAISRGATYYSVEYSAERGHMIRSNLRGTARCGGWLLRSPNKEAEMVSCITSSGSFSSEYTAETKGIRPAFRLDLSACADTLQYRDAPLEAGEFVSFGHYEQDNDTTNGPEEIRWKVLDVDEQTHAALLLSSYALEARPFESEAKYGDVTWEGSEMRSWLNTSFLNTAFTPEEQETIAMCTISTVSGNKKDVIATQDRVFLLSSEEVEWYLCNFTLKQTIPTPYAKNNVLYQSDSDSMNGEGCVYWWLRSPVRNMFQVLGGGENYISPQPALDGKVCVRPVLVLYPDGSLPQTDAVKSQRLLCTESDKPEMNSIIIPAAPGDGSTLDAATEAAVSETQPVTETVVSETQPVTEVVVFETQQAPEVMEHVHSWADATCTRGRICTACGEEQGVPLGHDWEEATCTTAVSCRRCGETAGNPIGHSWIDATCTNAQKCLRCEITTGTALGHRWIEATSTAPKTCAVCGITEGTAIGSAPQAAYLNEMPYYSLTGKIWTRSNEKSSTFSHGPWDAPGCWSDTSTPGHTTGVVQDNGGNVYTYGLHVDGNDIGPYSVSYALNGRYSTFSGVCGYPAAVISPQWSPVYTKYFCIYGDGMLLYTSPRMNAHTASVAFEIPVSGVNILTIQYPAIDGPNEVATLFDGMVK